MSVEGGASVAAGKGAKQVVVIFEILGFARRGSGTGCCDGCGLSSDAGSGTGCAAESAAESETRSLAG